MMNKVFGIAICLLLVFPVTSFAQATVEAQTKLYQTAYQHILQSPEFKAHEYEQPCVAVFDSIVHRDQFIFSEVLGKRWGYTSYQQQDRMMDSLFAVEDANQYKPFYSPAVAHLTATSGAQKDCSVIIFSRLNNDMLLAEVSWNQQGGASLRHILPMFGQTLLYLLFFAPDGKVQQYHTMGVSYN